MGAPVEVAKARRHNFSSSKGSCLGIINIRYRDKLGTASYQLSSSKLVLNGDCGVHKTEAAKL